MKTTLPTRSQAWKHYKELWSGYHLEELYDEFDKNHDRKLELWMFIACDKNGEPLEELKKPLSQRGETSRYEMRYNIEYQQALDKVIFKGFEFDYKTENLIHFKDNGISKLWYIEEKIYWEFTAHELISDLCEKVELTDKEYKRLNLG